MLKLLILIINQIIIFKQNLNHQSFQKKLNKIAQKYFFDNLPEDELNLIIKAFNKENINEG